MFSALSAINKGYRAANGDIFDERIWLSADDAMALVVDHHQGDVKLLTGNHKYTVLHGLEKLGLLDRVTEPKLRFSLNKKGFVCGPCIVKNGWV